MTRKVNSDTAPLKTQTTRLNVPELISLQALAAHLEISSKTLKTWITSGKIPAPSRIGNRKQYRFEVAKINAWLLAQESK